MKGSILPAPQSLAQTTDVKTCQTFCEKTVNTPNNLDFCDFGFACARVLHNAVFTQVVALPLTPLALCLIHTP